MADDNAEGNLVASQLKEMQDQIKSLKTKIESAEARAQQAEETVRNAGTVAGTVETVHTSNHAKIKSGEASALQRAEDAVIIAGNNVVRNAGIKVVDNVDNVGVPAVETAHTSYHEAEIIDGHKVISDFVGAECSKIEGKWDRKADLHCEPVVKDFMEIVNNMRNNMRKAGSGWDGEHSLQYLESPSSEDVVKYFTFDCSVTNSSDVVENNMRKDSNSTLSGWTGEHSLQYLESPVVKDFTFDCNVTNGSGVVENNMRKDSISPLSGWTEEHALLYLESPTSSEEESVYTIFGNWTENEDIKAANEEAIVTEIDNPQENQDAKPIGSWVWGRRSLESSLEEEAVKAIEEAIVAEPKKSQEREDGVNMEYREGKFNEKVEPAAR